jgi:hypothetical protein
MRPRLFSFELAWTDAAFDAIYPEGTALPHGIRELNPPRYVDDLLLAIPLEQSMGLRVALWIVALAPLFVLGKLATIASISPEDRARVLERLLASPVYAVRQLTLSLKAMATLLYVQSAPARRSMMVPVPTSAGGLVARRSPKKSRGDHEHAAE